MSRFLASLVIVVLAANVCSPAPSRESYEKPNSDCETCNWQDSSNKLNELRTNGVVADRCIQPGTLALTFDDGPHVSFTPGVLDVLKAENVTATFFVNGENYWPPLDHEPARELLKRTQNDGHYIASHTWSHHRLTLQTSETIRYEMTQLSNKLFEILGENPNPVMRPPYGKFNDSVVDIINGELGYKFVLWSICPCDWGHVGNPDLSIAEYKRVLEGTDPQTTLGFISLHHDPVRGSPELATMVIKYVRSKGYRFVGLPECLGLPERKL